MTWFIGSTSLHACNAVLGPGSPGQPIDLRLLSTEDLRLLREIMGRAREKAATQGD